MQNLLFRIHAVSDLLSRAAALNLLLATHKRADPDALASVVFSRLLSMERNKVSLDFALDANPALCRRLPLLFEQKGSVLGMPILDHVPDGRPVLLLDACQRRMAFVPTDNEDEGGPKVKIVGSIDHHVALEEPDGLNLYLPASSMSVVFAELGFAIFPRTHPIWTNKDWQDLAALLVIGIASDAGFTVPHEDGHLWNLSRLPLGSRRDLAILHALVDIASRSVLEDFEAEQMEMLCSIQEDIFKTIFKRIQILYFGGLENYLRGMVGAKVDAYLADRADLAAVVAFYGDDKDLRYSARVRKHCQLLPQLTTALCSNHGAVKNHGQQAGGTVVHGTCLEEACDICRTVASKMMCEWQSGKECLLLAPQH